jgi:tetratricopeptide (TPR) repeat protein
VELKSRGNHRSGQIYFIVLFSTMVGLAAEATATVHDDIPTGIEALYDAGSYSAAAQALQTAVDRSPNDASLYHWLGRCYFEIRDFDRSIANWERAVALNSARSEYHDWLGRAYGRKAEQDAHTKMASALSLARRTHHEFEVAVQLDSRNIDAQRDLISFMASAPSNLGGGEERALSQIDALSAVDAVEGMLARADLYAERKKFEQAGDEYQKVLKSVPDRIDAYFEVADYYRDRSDAEHMDQAVESALKVAPSDRRLNYYRGVALVLANKDSETSERDLRTYINTVPDNSELPSRSSAYRYLGELYENRGQPDLAAEQYKAGLALDPQNKALREALKKLQEKEK